MIGSAEAFKGLYYLNIRYNIVYASAIDALRPDMLSDTFLWHFRLGHLSHTRMNLLMYKFFFMVVYQKVVCDICHLARHKKLPFATSFNKASKSYDLINFDKWGPHAIKYVHGHSYFLTHIDDYIRYIWVILMKSKVETRQNIINFVNLIET